jgi:AraC family transcriptional regulator
MSSRWLDLVGCESSFINSPAYFQSGRPGQLMAKIYLEFCKFDEFSPLVIEGLVLEMLGQASRQSVKHRSRNGAPGWLARVRELLHDRFDEGLPFSEIARTAGVHETHLSREFHRYFGCTVGEYVRRLRVDFACRRLSATDAPLAEIALAAGFFDQSHFTRTFKSQTGMTPHKYRRVFGPR